MASQINTVDLFPGITTEEMREGNTQGNCTKFITCVDLFKINMSEAYSEASQTSKAEYFVKILAENC